MTTFNTNAKYGLKLNEEFSKKFGSAPLHELNWIGRRQIIQGGV